VAAGYIGGKLGSGQLFFQDLPQPVDQGAHRHVGIGVVLLRPEGLQDQLGMSRFIFVGDQIFKEFPCLFRAAGDIRKRALASFDHKAAQGINLHRFCLGV
jgi:hypothetical protein